jgi:DNA modification methylase
MITKEYITELKNRGNGEISKVIENKNYFTFVCGDSLEILKLIPDETVNCVVTSPPYWNLREYDVAEDSNVIGNEPKYQDYVKNLTELFDEVQRILTKDGSLWLNLGDKYHNKELLGLPWRVALSLMDKGWILRNDVIWDQMKGTQSSKDRLRDVYEHIFHFVKSKKYYYAHNEIRIAPIKKPKVYNGEVVSYEIQQQIAALIEKSFYLRTESERLLAEAKEMVDREIGKGK